VLACHHLYRTSSTPTRLRTLGACRMDRQRRALSGDSLKSPRGIGKGHAQEGDRRMRLWALPPASRRGDNASMRAIDRPRPSPCDARFSPGENKGEKARERERVWAHVFLREARRGRDARAAEDAPRARRDAPQRASERARDRVPPRPLPTPHARSNLARSRVRALRLL
jgi:hypothetical protein